LAHHPARNSAVMVRNMLGNLTRVSLQDEGIRVEELGKKAGESAHHPARNSAG
jgi:hypothetical protein